MCMGVCIAMQKKILAIIIAAIASNFRICCHRHLNEVDCQVNRKFAMQN